MDGHLNLIKDLKRRNFGSNQAKSADEILFKRNRSSGIRTRWI